MDEGGKGGGSIVFVDDGGVVVGGESPRGRWIDLRRGTTIDEDRQRDVKVDHPRRHIASLLVRA